MWDMPHAAIKVNILSHGHASDDPEKAGAAPYEMTVPHRLQTCQRMPARPSIPDDSGRSRERRVAMHSVREALNAKSIKAR
jgi:hypothetical protein